MTTSPSDAAVEQLRDALLDALHDATIAQHATAETSVQAVIELLGVALACLIAARSDDAHTDAGLIEDVLTHRSLKKAYQAYRARTATATTH